MGLCRQSVMTPLCSDYGTRERDRASLPPSTMASHPKYKKRVMKKKDFGQPKESVRKYIRGTKTHN